MVSSCSTSHSLASELMESNDGHEEIIKVSLVHLHFFSLQACKREQLNLPKGACGLVRKNLTHDVASQSPPGKILVNNTASR